MPEPFKNVFSPKSIAEMAGHLQRVWPGFDGDSFVSAASDGLAELELKERSQQIYRALAAVLPPDFTQAGPLLERSLASLDWEERAAAGDAGPPDGITSWSVMPLTYYVSQEGQDHFELSLSLLQAMTQRFSAEFDIRFFLLARPHDTLAVLTDWTSHESHHVRRLVSEGTRPRLPWAMRLPRFVADPEPVIGLLERLKDDDSEYVRRSVANNLNDIAKDHPERVAEIARHWLAEATPPRQKLVRHACRSLIKQGHPATLDALGYGPPQVRLDRLDITTPEVHLGGALIFDVKITSTGKDPQPLVLDYVVHHQKANGKTSPKVFKWKTVTLAPGASLDGQRKHAIRPITTRVYYPGRHGLELLVNGASLGRRDFDLILKK